MGLISAILLISLFSASYGLFRRWVFEASDVQSGDDA